VDWFHYTFAGPTITQVAVKPPKSNFAATGNKFAGIRCLVGSTGRTIFKLPGNPRSVGHIDVYDVMGKSIPFTIEQSGIVLLTSHMSSNVVFIKTSK
jgi:hypothetical protein